MCAEKSPVLRKRASPPPGSAVFKWPKSKFWSFSLKAYARPGVSSLCLELQDKAGADVNILLLCLWLARAGKAPLSPPMLESLERDSANWRQTVIHPLRAARRNLAKLPATPSNQRIKAQIQKAELEAERRAQLDLEAEAARLLPGLEYPEKKQGSLSPGETARISLGHYLELIGAGDEEMISGLLDRLAAEGV